MFAIKCPQNVDVGRVEAGKFIKAVRQPIQQIQIILLFFTFFCYLYLPHYNTNLQGSTINKVKYNFEDGEDVTSNKI